MTRVPIDTDGRLVVDETVRLCGHFGVECLILCDMSHRFEKVGARTLVASGGADSVNSALINLLRPGDVVVIQDCDLTAIYMVRGARILDQDGMGYTAQSIDALLLARHTAKKIRNASGRLKGSRKRLPKQGQVLCGRLARLLGEE